MRRRPWHLVSVYPDLLGTYGDQGNAVVLERRLAWRGIDVRLSQVGFGESVPGNADLYLLGGGEDEAQTLALDRLRTSAFPDAVRGGAQVLAVCAGLQLLGNTFATASGSREGLGILDLTTTRLAARAVGEVLVTPDVGVDLPAITGFTNHAGCSVLGPKARPLGRVSAGLGNTGKHRDLDGAVQGAVVGTYLHGPVLARNPAFADWVLRRMVGPDLPELGRGLPEQLHDRRSAFVPPSRRSRRATTNAV